MKKCGEQIHTFITSTLDGSEWSAPHLAAGLTDINSVEFKVKT